MVLVAPKRSFSAPSDIFFFFISQIVEQEK